MSPHSRLAFEGFAYAEERGLGQRYTERMFRAFFVEQLDMGGPEIPVDVAKELGLDGDAFRSAVESRALRCRAPTGTASRSGAGDHSRVWAFLVDGQRLEGMPSAEGMHRLLDGAAVLR